MTEEKKEIPVFEKKQDSIEKILDDFEQLYQEEICASNNLLGKFVDGKYIIPREIKEDLVKHKKILTSQEDDKVYCVLRHELDVFHLTLFIEDYGEEKQIAKLYLVEKIKEEDFDLRSFIAEFISDRRPDFMFKSQIVFNIILTEESKGLDEDEDEFADMKHIQEKLLENKKQHEEDLEFMTEMYSETYVKKMIEELKKMGPKGEKILKEFKEKVEKQKTEQKVSSKVYTKLKKQLDVIIKKNGGLKELVKQNPNITKVVKEYTEPIKAYKQLMKKDIVLGKQEKPVDKSSEKKAPAKKPAAKKASSSKSGGKKSGGAKPKKAEKKEEKKKDKKKDEKKKIYAPIPKKEEKAGQKAIKKANPQKPVEPNIKKNGDLIITPINVKLLDDTLSIIKTGLELKKTQSLEESLDNVVEAREKAPNADNVRPRETEAFEAVNLAVQEAERQMPDDVLNEASEGSSKMDELFENIKHKEHQKGPQKE